MGLFSCLRKVQPEEAPVTKKPSKYAELAAWSDSTSNTLAHDPRKVNVMDVTLVKASGLLAMDTNLFSKNTSDPLAILRCAGLEFRSTRSGWPLCRSARKLKTPGRRYGDLVGSWRRIQ